jgi:multiple sugar transport system substrate-binding protein
VAPRGVLRFLQRLTVGKKLVPSTATATTSSSLFSQGKVGCLFDGVWQLPTYRSVVVSPDRVTR